MKKIKMWAMPNYVLLLLLSCTMSFYACKKNDVGNAPIIQESLVDYTKLFKELSTIQPQANSISSNELIRLAEDMIEVEPSVEKIESTLRKVYQLNTVDMENLYSIIGKRNTEIAEANGLDVTTQKAELPNWQKLAHELNQKAIKKYGKDFYRISIEQQNELLDIENTASTNNGKVQEWCGWEDYSRTLYYMKRNGYYSATKVSLTRTNWTDIATGCDYKVSFPKIGYNWYATTTNVINAINKCYNGKISAQNNPSHMVVGRLVNLFGIGDATLGTQLKLPTN